jgi:hypothetical protein
MAAIRRQLGLFLCVLCFLLLLTSSIAVVLLQLSPSLLHRFVSIMGTFNLEDQLTFYGQNDAQAGTEARGATAACDRQRRTFLRTTKPLLVLACLA